MAPSCNSARVESHKILVSDTMNRDAQYLLQPGNVLCGPVLELGSTSREDKAVSLLREPVLVGFVVCKLRVRHIGVPYLPETMKNVAGKRHPQSNPMKPQRDASVQKNFVKHSSWVLVSVSVSLGL